MRSWDHEWELAKRGIGEKSQEEKKCLESLILRELNTHLSEWL